MNTGIIKREELLAEINEESYGVGTYVTHHDELYRIAAINESNRYVLERLHPETWEVMEVMERTLSNLKEYYKPVNVPIDKVKELALRILAGEDLEETEESDSTELMAMSGKNTLVALREEASKAELVAQKVRHYAEIIIAQRTAELQVDKPDMTVDEYDHNYMDGWNTDGYRKATAEEIVEHFSNK